MAPVKIAVPGVARLTPWARLTAPEKVATPLSLPPTVVLVPVAVTLMVLGTVIPPAAKRLIEPSLVPAVKELPSTTALRPKAVALPATSVPWVTSTPYSMPLSPVRVTAPPLPWRISSPAYLYKEAGLLLSVSQTLVEISRPLRVTLPDV